mgnify:FL=1|tara:strand:- start:58508 stop:58876 length:369 start_codon:yes stop_codon:yes gene_type:complete
MLTRRSLITALTVIATGFAIPADGAENDQFLSVIEDMPLMPGLIEVADAATVFETTRGRIVEAWAEGDAAMSAITDFYDATLPQLGWSRLAAGSYRREGETLTIEQISGGAPTTVRFTLTPD